jgi:hypothetical protein
VRRSRVVPAGLILAVASTLGLSACGQQSGLDLAREACVHVEHSLHDYALSIKPGMAASRAAAYRGSADFELRAALPLAAKANSADGSWNSLMTTISEGATVDEAHLEPALKAICIAANTNININPAGPGANVNPAGPGANVNPAGPSGSP